MTSQKPRARRYFLNAFDETSRSHPIHDIPPDQVMKVVTKVARQVLDGTYVSFFFGDL